MAYNIRPARIDEKFARRSTPEFSPMKENGILVPRTASRESPVTLLDDLLGALESHYQSHPLQGKLRFWAAPTPRIEPSGQVSVPCRVYDKEELYSEVNCRYLGSRWNIDTLQDLCWVFFNVQHQNGLFHTSSKEERNMAATAIIPKLYPHPRGDVYARFR